MTVFSQRFRASVALRHIDIEISNSAIERIHRAIEAEIGRGSKRLENAAKKGHPDMLDSLIDDECEEIEDLLEISFVAGQSFINRIRSRVSALDRACLADFGERLFLRRRQFNERSPQATPNSDDNAVFDCRSSQWSRQLLQAFRRMDYLRIGEGKRFGSGLESQRLE